MDSKQILVMVAFTSFVHLTPQSFMMAILSISDNSTILGKLAVGLVLLFTESILPIFKHI